jgi:CDP-glucose 4,6-dehydratase
LISSPINGYIISKIKNKIFKIRSNGKLVRDYLYVGDAVNAYYLTMEALLMKKDNLRIYNVGSKYNLNVLEMTKKVSKIVDNKKPKIKILNSSKNEIASQKLNYKKIVKELGWKQKVDLNNGLRKTVEWYKKYNNFFN